MSRTQTVKIYNLHYIFLDIPRGIIFINKAAIVPLFQGFQLIGRQTSLNSFETAPALDAPMHNSPSSGRRAELIMKAAGDRPVKYGKLNAANEIGTDLQSSLGSKMSLRI